MFFQVNGIEMTLEVCFLLTFSWVLVIVIVHVVEERGDQRLGNHDPFPRNVAGHGVRRSLHHQQTVSSNRGIATILPHIVPVLASVLANGLGRRLAGCEQFGCDRTRHI